jgi:hypothetical protein
MSPRRSYREIASRPRPGGTLGAIIDAAEKMPRTLPRDPASREALESVGERPERLGPPRTEADAKR